MTKFKATLGMLLAAVLVGVFAVASSAGSSSSPRFGELHLTKECSQYFGLAGQFCTITWSNLDAIPAGTKVVYISAPGATSLNSDIVLDGPGSNDAFGHVTLDFATATGRVTVSGGSGRLTGFHASARVTYNQDENLWHWDGSYGFTRPASTSS